MNSVILVFSSSGEGNCCGGGGGFCAMSRKTSCQRRFVATLGLRSDCGARRLFSFSFAFDAGRAGSPLHAAWRFVIDGAHGVTHPTCATLPARDLFRVQRRKSRANGQPGVRRAASAISSVRRAASNSASRWSYGKKRFAGSGAIIVAADSFGRSSGKSPAPEIDNRRHRARHRTFNTLAS